MYDKEFEQKTQAFESQACLAKASTPASPLQQRLQSDAANLRQQLYRTERAAYILQLHPEFELLLELLTLIAVPIRVAPFQSDRALVLG